MKFLRIKNFKFYIQSKKKILMKRYENYLNLVLASIFYYLWKLPYNGLMAGVVWIVEIKNTIKLAKMANIISKIMFV